jgi:hypothetical protein
MCGSQQDGKEVDVNVEMDENRDARRGWIRRGA